MNFQTNQPSPNTKKCKYCGSDIPEQAKVCPYCNKKQSHTVRNVVLIIVGIVVLLILLFSCVGGGGSRDETSSTDTGTTTQNDTSSNTADNSNQGTAVQPEQTQQDYTVGATFEEDGISVTLDSVSISNGGEYSAPEVAGNVFLVATWTITNNSSEDYTNTIQFDGYVDGSKTDEVFHSDVAESLIFGETLIPGSSMTASTLYEIPAGWTQFQERVKIAIMGGDSATFTITPNQIS